MEVWLRLKLSTGLCALQPDGPVGQKLDAWQPEAHHIVELYATSKTDIFDI